MYRACYLRASTGKFVGFFRSVGVALPVLLLGACAAAPPHPNVSAAAERALFIEANRDIIAFHIKKVLPGALDMAGLARLSALDPALSIERSSGGVILRRHEETRRFLAPPAKASAWGALTTKVIAAARTMSLPIAAIPANRLDEMIIDASLASLDRYSRYARPRIARRHRAGRDGFGGIGVTLDIRDRAVRIASVLPDTPAAIAGLRTGDRIVALDGVSVASLGIGEIGHQLRGPARTRLQIAVLRRGSPEPLEISMLRATIVPESVTLRDDDGLAWLRIRSFNESTAQSLARLLHHAHRKLGRALRGIVLDLRGNPGGLLDQAVDVASIFLDGGEVLSTIGRIPQSMQHFAAIRSRHTETLPLVVLIDGGSASASEVVAAALQDAGRAVVVGTSSYSKGTVQTVLRTANNGELTITWAQIITPDGYFLNRHGVVPTVCTAEARGPESIEALLSRSPDPVPVPLARARAHLDDAGWRRLRAHCPPGHSVHGMDRLAAIRLLDDRALYRNVLASLDTTQVAVNR